MLDNLPKTSDELKGKSWADVQPFFDDLEGRTLTAETISEWLADFSAVKRSAGRIWIARLRGDHARYERCRSRPPLQSLRRANRAAGTRRRPAPQAEAAQQRLRAGWFRGCAAQSARGSRSVPRGEPATADRRSQAADSVQPHHWRAVGQLGRAGQNDAPDGTFAAGCGSQRARARLEGGLAAPTGGSPSAQRSLERTADAAPQDRRERRQSRLSRLCLGGSQTLRLHTGR